MLAVTLCVPAIMLPSNPAKYPPVERPTTKTRVLDLLKELGHNVKAWSETKTKGKMENPNVNTYRNSQWAFVDPDGQPSVVCLWYTEIEHKADPAYYDGNDRKYRNDLMAKGEFSRENLKKNKGRLSAWLDRSHKLENVIRGARDNRQPLRVIVVGGTRKDELERELSDLPNLDAASKVEVRGLDPAPWWVHSFDGDTGRYRVYRDVPPPPEPQKEDPATLDPGNDPLFARYLETLNETEREAVIKARVGQGLFRDRLIERWEGQCAVTGIKAPNLLIASHIRPWSACDTAEQRISAANGLLLTPNLDKLFDKGLISFDENFKMIIGPALPSGIQTQFGLMPQMRLRKRHEDSIEFLRWHRQAYFPDSEQLVSGRSTMD